MKYIVKMTDRSNLEAERIQMQIYGKEFRFGYEEAGHPKLLRGYVYWMERDEESGQEVLHSRGPVWLKLEDLEERDAKDIL